MRCRALEFFAVIGVIILSQSSGAAERPGKPAAATPPYNWSGWYVGANLGYGQSNANWTNQQNTTLFGDYVSGQGFSNAMSGIVGGGQIGYNVQRGRWVYGIEAMLDASAIKGTFDSNIPTSAMDDRFEARIKALMLFTGRAGYTWNNILAYGKAGIATAKISASVSDSVGVSTGSGSDSQWRSGPTLGLGIEYGIAPNLSFGVEYDYIRLSSSTFQLGGSGGSYLWDVDVRNVSLLMAKLNYRLNWLR